MIHARKDYDRMQDPALDDPSLLAPGATPIGADEPVFLLRAQDVLFVDMIEHYMDMLYDLDYVNMSQRDAMVQSARDHITRALQWQKSHHTKHPDL